MSADYQEVCSNFVWSRPEKYNFARDVIDKWAESDPNKLAMHWVDDHGSDIKRTFTDFSNNSKKVANLLTEHGVARGDAVIIILGREIAWWEVTTGCTRMGAIYSPGTLQLSAKDIAYRINSIKAVAIVTNSLVADKVDQITSQCPSLKTKILVDDSKFDWINYDEALSETSAEFDTVDTDANEDAICFFTSGTTGFPKMCIHNHLYPSGHITTGKYWLDLNEDDLHWNMSDTGWAKAAWSSYYGPWLCGAATFIHHTTGFNAQKTLSMFGKYPITTFCGAPTIFRMLVLENLASYSFKNLRHCVAAGEPLNPEVMKVWKEATGVVIRDGYGQTESVILCGNMLSMEPRFGSMGKPMPGIQLGVIDDNGHEVGIAVEGDIAVKITPERPVGLFKEYKGEPKKTANTIRGDWYITGDRATRDKDGYFWFVSRSDDVILSAGYRIGPFEVESALLEHPAVTESAVVSSPDESRGEVVKAFVVLASGFTPDEQLITQLQNHVKTQTAPYKYPRKIEFVESLPKTVSGKIRRIELRQQEWGS